MVEKSENASLMVKEVYGQMHNVYYKEQWQAHFDDINRNCFGEGAGRDVVLAVGKSPTAPCTHQKDYPSLCRESQGF